MFFRSALPVALIGLITALLSVMPSVAQDVSHNLKLDPKQKHSTYHRKTQLFNNKAPLDKTSYKERVFQRNVENLYMVLLNDEPLALQQTTNVSLAASNTLIKPLSSKKLNVRSVTSQRYLSELAVKRHNTMAQLSSTLKRQMVVKHQYQYALNGFTTTLSNAELAQVKSHDNVKKVMKITPQFLATDAGPSFIKAPAIWNGEATGVSSQGEGVIIGVIDSGISPEHRSFAEQGDDGYRHINPLGSGQYLGDCALSAYAHYCNDKLIGIWSHPDITNDYTPQGDDPIGIDHDGHGTHVASIAGGNVLHNVHVWNVISAQAEFTFDQISGVAPHANIVSYQVCAADDGCWPDLTALAVEHAIENGVDVLNYSVSGDALDPWSSIDALAFLSAREAGIHVVVAAGNNGPSSKTVGSPGNAPWLTTVAAYSHDRGFSSKTVSFSGGSTVLDTFEGAATTSGIIAEVVDAENFGDKYCLTPFPANTFNGKVVVCVRKDIPRVEKGSNVLAGGASGLILINDPTTPDIDDVFSDFHVLPAIHINNQQGERLVEWLASGSGHRATISAVELVKDNNIAEILGDFSARGPELIFEQWLVPDISAPGVDVYGAYSEYQPHRAFATRDEAPFAFLSGSSMSTPHVAGAFALMTALHRNWTPAQMQSAIMLTAQQSVRKNVDNNIVDASFFDAGAGSIRIDKAVNTGLLMDVSIREYEGANPNVAGQPQTLNLPAAVAKNCELLCTWTKTFTATQSASWLVNTETLTNGLILQTDQSAFSLSAGQSIELLVTARVNNSYEGGYLAGNIHLIPTDSRIATTTLPVTANFIVGALPDETTIVASSNNGRAKIAGITTVGTEDLQIKTLSLSAIEQDAVTIQRDDFDESGWPIDIFNNNSFVHHRSVVLEQGTKIVTAEITQTTSPDLDLYIGKDFNFNGRGDTEEEFRSACKANSDISLERCVLNNPEAGQYFITIYNYGDHQNRTGISDTVNYQWASVSSTPSNVLTVDYESVVTANDEVNISLNWQSLANQNQQYLTALEVGLDSDRPNNIGLMPITIIRDSNILSASFNTHKALVTEDVILSIQVDANTSNNVREFTLSTTLPSGMSFVSASQQASLNGQVLSFPISQSANSSAQTIDIILLLGDSLKGSEQRIVLSYRYLDQNKRFTTDVITVYGELNALIEGLENYRVDGEESSTITLSANQSSASHPSLPLSYQWRQLSGITAVLNNINSENLSVELPDVDSEQSIIVELVVDDGRSPVQTAMATINIKQRSQTNNTTNNTVNNTDSGGGSFSVIFLVGLILITLHRKKYVNNLNSG
jgi:subtilisin family serine protease